jgi:putrescine aminotransferase
MVVEPFVADPDAFTQDVLEDYERYVGSSVSRLYRFMGVDSVEWRGAGALVWDVHGREYIDCGGYGVFFHGRSHPRIVAAVREQLERLALTSRLLPHRGQAELARLLAERTPGDLQYTFFCNSGAEAVEGALKLARAATGRTAFARCTASRSHPCFPGSGACRTATPRRWPRRWTAPWRR